MKFQGRTSTSPIIEKFDYDLNGFSPNKIHDYFIDALKIQYQHLDNKKTYYFTGHGGSIFNKKKLLDCFMNKPVIDHILIYWKNYQFPDTLCQDFFFSILLIINGGTIGPYLGHGDCFQDRINPNIAVQHQYKKWYGVPIPENLKHLIEII